MGSISDSEKRPGPLNPFQLMLTTVLELDPRTGNQVHHRSRDKDLTFACQTRHPCRYVHTDTRYVIAVEFDLPCVKTSADFESEVANGLGYRPCAFDGPSRSVEDCQGAVSGRPDESTTEVSESALNQLIVKVQRLFPASIAELHGMTGRIDDVGEQDRCQHTIEYRNGSNPGQELLDFAKYILGSTR